MAHKTPATAEAPLDWLYGRINYERSSPIPYSEQGMKLDRMRELLRRLGNPQQQLRILHVAGTKGKGSTSAMLASALTESGLRTGVYSSPHLERFEERIAVDGVPCSSAELRQRIEQVRPVAETMDREAIPAGPTFFDLATAMALLHFAEVGVDVVVLEVGLGGRLDSTNVCTPEVAVVTSISFDHTRQLGTTLAQIAAEKAGIFKQGIPVISGVVEPEPGEVIARMAGELACPLWQRGRDFFIDRSTDGAWCFQRRTPSGIEQLDDLRPAMRGEVQAANAAVALATLGVLRDQGWNLPPEACRLGIAQAQLPARMERFDTSPLVVLDSAHNGASSEALAEMLQEVVPQKADRTLILAMAEDKDVRSVLAPLVTKFDRVIVTRFIENPRAIDPEQLATLVTEFSTEKKTKVLVLPTPADAWCEAVRRTDRAGLIVVAGSFFLAAEIRPLLRSHDSTSQQG